MNGKLTTQQEALRLLIGCIKGIAVEQATRDRSGTDWAEYMLAELEKVEKIICSRWNIRRIDRRKAK